MADETIKIDIIGNADNYSKSVKKAALVTKELEDAKKRLFEESGNLSNALSLGGYALGAFTAAATATAAAVAIMAKGQLEASRQINKLSGSSALAKDTIAGLRVAALQAGVAVEDLVPVDFADKLEELRAGSASFVDDFGLIGLAAKDFQDLSVDESFKLFTERLIATKDESKQAAAATRILSTAGENLLAALKDNNKELSDYIALGKLVGAGAEENQAAINELADAYAQLAIGYDAVSGSATRALVAIAPFATATGSISSDVASVSTVVDLLAAQFENINRLLRGDFQSFWDAEPLKDAFQTGYKLRLELSGAADEGRRFQEAMTLAREQSQKQLYIIKEIGGELEDNLNPVRMEKKANELGESATKGFIEGLGKGPEDALKAALGFEDFKVWESGQLAAIEEQGMVAGDMFALGFGVALDAGVQSAVNQGLKEIEETNRAHEKKTAGERRESLAKEVSYQLGAVQSASQAWIDILSKGSKEQKKMALVIFNIQKAAGVAQAGINTALAISEALKAAAPPWNFVLAGIAGAAGTAAALAVAAQPPPQFHIGSRAGDLAPDEMHATITRRESVLTPQGVAQLNAGRNNGNADGDGAMYVILDHEVVGRAAARSARRPGSALHRAMGKDLPGHSRRGNR